MLFCHSSAKWEEKTIPAIPNRSCGKTQYLVNKIEVSLKALNREILLPSDHSPHMFWGGNMDCSQLFPEIPLALTHFWKRSWFIFNCLVSIQHIFFQGWTDKSIAIPQVKLKVWLQVLHMQTVCQVPPFLSPFCSLHLHLTQLCTSEQAASVWTETFRYYRSFLYFLF